jgi:hypothetical protein
LWNHMRGLLDEMVQEGHLSASSLVLEASTRPHRFETSRPDGKAAAVPPNTSES